MNTSTYVSHEDRAWELAKAGHRASEIAGRAGIPLRKAQRMTWVRYALREQARDCRTWQEAQDLEAVTPDHEVRDLLRKLEASSPEMFALTAEARAIANKITNHTKEPTQ